MQIKEFAGLAGVSVRTLHYYDEIGLLKPAHVDKETGYRYYDETSVLRMQEILFYRELDFSLKSIKEILSSPYYYHVCTDFRFTTGSPLSVNDPSTKKIC